MGLDSAGTMLKREDTGRGSLGDFHVKVLGSGVESEGQYDQYEGCCPKPC